MALIPGEGREPWGDDQAYADDAASAAAYVLRALETGDAREAAWAARRSYEAADHYVMYRVGVEGEEQVLIHPIVQGELARQHRDIEALLSADDNDRDLIVRLRERANEEGREFLIAAR